METKNKVANIECVSSENFYASPAGVFVVIDVILFFYLAIFTENSISNCFWITGIAIVISIIICCCVKSSWNKKVANLKATRDKIVEELQKTAPFIYESLTLDVKGLCISEKAKAIIIFNGTTKNPKMCKYSDILTYELLEDGNQAIQGKGFQTYAAGRYLGPNAALAVANSTRQINSYCTNLTIVIHTKSIEDETFTINLIDNHSTDKNGDTYKALYNFAKEIIATMDKIVNINKENIKEVEVKEPKKKSTKNDDSKYSELKELKQLLDEGIITEEEFNEKKKEILKLKS